jgi:large subunit ribosomal protein L22
MEAHAIARNVKGSAQKNRLVIDLIRGLKVNEALAILGYTNKRAAHPVERLLRSAIANAEQKAQAENISVDVDELWVKECHVDKGVTKNRRRVRPAPMGRAYRERRHYSHITIAVSSEKRETEAKRAPKAKPAAKPAPQAASEPTTSASTTEETPVE